MGRRDKSNYKFVNKSVEDEAYQKETPQMVQKPKGKANQIKFRTEEGLCGGAGNSIGLEGGWNFDSKDKTEACFPGGPVTKTPCSKCKGAQVQSLVRELDPACSN